jgi:hypothetical protein
VWYVCARDAYTEDGRHDCDACTEASLKKTNLDKMTKQGRGEGRASTSDNELGDIEIKDYVTLPSGEDKRLTPHTLTMDVTLAMTSDRFGSSTHRTNGTLSHIVSSTGAPQPDGVLKNAVSKKIRHYRQLYADKPVIFLSVTSHFPVCHCEHFVVYYESIKRELNIRLIYECRCDEKLKAKAEGSTPLTYTGLRTLRVVYMMILSIFFSCMCIVRLVF